MKERNVMSLNKSEIDAIVECIKTGKQIPENFKDILFPTDHVEYQLDYAGKMRKEDLLANADGTFPVPLQVDRRFNASSNESEWSNIIAFGDNLQFLKTLNENKDPIIKDKVKGKVKLIYIDPPFATTDDFGSQDGAKAYTDKKKGAEFVEFFRRRLIVAKELLAPDGSIYVHLDEHMSHYARVILDEVFGKERFVSEIIWSFGRIGGNAKKFEKNHEVIFWYSNSKTFIFNKDAARQPYDAAFLATCKKDDEGKLYYTRGMGKDGDKLNRKKISYINPLGKSPSNVWDGIVYSPTSKMEKTGYPTQKPEELIKRIVVASTNENDIVLDFFGGSGTTAAVAEKLNRKWIVCDIGKLSYYTIQKRILEIEKSKALDKKNGKYGKEAKPFFTCSLGLYDLKNTLEMEFDNYKEFVAELFEIESKKTEISGYEFDGKKDSSLVKIFNYQKFKDADIDEDYIHNIHNIVRNKVGDKVYIVAPLNRIEFITDYYEIDNVRYYFLKIPYEIIKELHQRPFQKYRQPKSINNVNSLDEAIEFHFIRKPEVISKIEHINNKFELVIEKFVSNELETVKNSDEKGIDEMDYLAAVFVDAKYDNKNFIMTDAYFADEFEKKSDSLSVKLKGIKPDSKVALIYTDIFGNDYTEIVKIVSNDL